MNITDIKLGIYSGIMCILIGLFGLIMGIASTPTLESIIVGAELDHKTYIWSANHTKYPEIDALFIKNCYSFANSRNYINTTYDCKHYARDFTNLMVILGYPVGSVSIWDENETRGHKLNYYEYEDGSQIYIEPQTCKFFPDMDSLTSYYYNYTKT